MGREIRRVPVGWQHPTEPNPGWREQAVTRPLLGLKESRLRAPDVRFRGLMKTCLRVAQEEWDAEYAAWRDGTHGSLDFYRSYHSRDGYVERDGSRSFNPIRFYAGDGTGTVVEELWVEDVDVADRRYFEDHCLDRPDESEDRMPDFGVPESDLGWCLYETVSEGTPVSPVFATAEELIEHLVAHGDDWSQKPMRRESAEALVRDGWCPSGVAVGGAFYANEEALVALDAGQEG